ncbi:hypothetical protein H6P81_006471 [Aristolochia fimbriata]|uniref:Cytochrome c oxidase assembly factor 5 n=1 Tax=Aristolochia fimbriata TaxID=158543 RepID=A0AAV7F0V6_ARIFI|nr:hypothetical protein H6P81_006471 [Aristolochia fimbriata]
MGPTGHGLRFASFGSYLHRPDSRFREFPNFGSLLSSEEVMAKSCKGLAMELVKCLSESDCVKVDKRSYRECAGETSPAISPECVGLRETYFNCKRGQVDMRARIRGNKGY